MYRHVQHEFVETEKKVLGRTNADITSVAGYAGGNKKASVGVVEKLFKKSAESKQQENDKIEDLVCYHNLLGKAEYGDLGYTEVVGMSVPNDKIENFALEYFSLYGRDSDRPDKVREYI